MYIYICGYLYLYMYISIYFNLDYLCYIYIHLCVQSAVIKKVVVIDQLHMRLITTIHKCIDIYNSCDTHTERTTSFQELTAALANDIPPKEGFSGWMRYGKKGYRIASIELLLAVDHLAQCRIMLRKLTQTCESSTV